MSLAQDANTGGVLEGIASRFADQDAARRAELDRLIRAGKGDKAPPGAARVISMPKPSKPKGPCAICGSRTIHKQTCANRPGGPVAARGKPKAGKSTPAAVKAPVQAAAAALDPATLRAVKTFTTGGLLELRRLVSMELRTRMAKAEEELAAMREAVGKTEAA